MKIKPISSKIYWSNDIKRQVKYMEKAALERILETEKKADQIIAEGIKESREIGEKSAATLKRLRTEYEDLLDIEVKKIIESKIKEAEAEVEKLQASIVSDCDEIKEVASSGIDKAVEYVIARIGDGKWQ